MVDLSHLGSNNGFFEKPNYRTSYRSSIDTIALNCLVFDKIAFFAYCRQTDKQMDSIDALSRCRVRRLNKTSRVHWLPVHNRIKFKISTMTHKAIYCDSGQNSVESPGILTIINGPEHDELSLVYSHLSCITWGPTCRLILEHGSSLWLLSMTSCIQTSIVQLACAQVGEAATGLADDRAQSGGWDPNRNSHGSEAWRLPDQLAT